MVTLFLLSFIYGLSVSSADPKPKFQNETTYKNMLNDEVKAGALSSGEASQRVDSFQLNKDGLDSSGSSNLIRVNHPESGTYEVIDVETNEIVDSGFQPSQGAEGSVNADASKPLTSSPGNGPAETASQESKSDVSEKTKAVPNENAHQQITTGVSKMASLLASPGVRVIMPGLKLVKAGHSKYLAARQSCLKSQLAASALCREETSPAMQSTLQNINLLLVGAQAIAVKDACSKMSKAMNIAKVGLTAYTVACGASKKICESHCRNAQEALGEIQKGLASSVSCVPLVLGGDCATPLSSYKAVGTQIHRGISEEMSQSLKTVTVGKNIKTCDQEYGKLLLSAGLGIVSIIKTYKDSRKCENDTDGFAVSSSSQPTQNTVTRKKAEQPKQTLPLPSSRGMQSVSSEKSSVASRNVAVAKPVQVSREEQEKNNPYRAYLPGGSKAVRERKPTGLEEWRREVTSAHGETNFNKLKSAYNMQRSRLIED
ncbi:hypothetical protein [Bdellovibrio sp. HCB-110]|uniref:hypothetical protein n=1 Tax=Bdellovibrio sp. HCB-110 TaxID=3391182 RepID=UPI0039B63AED